jgi:hypothetical protein
MLVAMIRYFAGQFYPQPGENLFGTLTFDHEDGLPGTISVPVEKLWRHFGKIHYARKGREFTLALRLPTLDLMVAEMEKWGRFKVMMSMLDEATEGLELFLPMFYGDGRPDMQRLLEFERLSEADQARGVRILRYLYAQANIRIDLGQLLEQELIRSKKRRAKVQHLKDMREDDLRLIALWIRFLQLLHWQDEAVPGTPINEFLPPGLQVFMGQSGDVPIPSEDEDEEGPPIVIDVNWDDKNVIDPADVNPDRWAFYQSLGCKRIVRAPGWFADREYVAYLIMTPGGRKIAVLDRNKYGNAAYIFRVSQQGVALTDWAEDAQLTKSEVIELHGTEGFTFVRRFIHAFGWENRFRTWFNQQ